MRSVAGARDRYGSAPLPGSPPLLITLASNQLAVLFAVVLNSTKQSPSQLDSSTLVAMGHLVCGAKTTEMNLFNAVEFR